MVKSARVRHPRRVFGVPGSEGYTGARKLGERQFGPDNYIIIMPLNESGYIVQEFPKSERVPAEKLHQIREQHGLETDSGSMYHRLVMEGLSDAEAAQIVYEHKGWL